MEIPTFTLFDVAVVAVILLSTLLAFVRGAIREMLTIVAWLGAIALAWYGFGPTRALAARTIETPWLADALTLVAVFLVPLIVFKVLGAVLVEQMPRGWVGHLDRSLGAIFGLLRGGLIVAAGWLGLSLVQDPASYPGWVAEARLLPYVQEAGALLQRFLPEPAGAGQEAAGRG